MTNKKCRQELGASKLKQWGYFCIIATAALSLLVGCKIQNSGENNIKEVLIEPVDCDAEQVRTENNYSISAEYNGEKIAIIDVEAKSPLTALEAAQDNEGGMFLSMADENNGALISCSSPAAGQMRKKLYVTKDRWQTYNTINIDQQIDGYPTSLSMFPGQHLYIGVQMRSNGYLFESTDDGKSWKPVIIDDSLKKCRYGYAPVYNCEKNNAYVLLECDGFYSLYQSDVALSYWKHVGNFSQDMKIEDCYMMGRLILSYCK